MRQDEVGFEIGVWIAIGIGIGIGIRIRRWDGLGLGWDGVGMGWGWDGMGLGWDGDGMGWDAVGWSSMLLGQVGWGRSCRDGVAWDWVGLDGKLAICSWGTPGMKVVDTTNLLRQHRPVNHCSLII